jgi:hypothetical protein
MRTIPKARPTNAHDREILTAARERLWRMTVTQDAGDMAYGWVLQQTIDSWRWSFRGGPTGQRLRKPSENGYGRSHVVPVAVGFGKLAA